MPVTAFEGPAGTGKTHNLMRHVASEASRRSLSIHERVLALTFMHGSRRRLDARLRDIRVMVGRCRASTVDSFARRLCRRWRSLAGDLGHGVPADDDHDATCRVAAALLARPIVQSWLVASYPFVVVDEAQDLSVERSEMIREAAKGCHVLLAFDEFQCLNPAMRPMPIAGWLGDVCDPIRLDTCRRTEDVELLNAARAVRDGRSVERNGRHFKVVITPGHVNHAATWLANFIAWRRGGSVVVLTPTRRGFAEAVVGSVTSKALGKRRNGPFPIRWEGSSDAELDAVWKSLAVPTRCTVDEALECIERYQQEPGVKSLGNWLRRRRSVLGIDWVAGKELRQRMGQELATRRHYGVRTEANFGAMTIQQAKNREFDHVAVVWPYRVPSDDGQKRRLLYNAITRARRSCVVLVQGDRLATVPPFVG